MTVSGMSLLFSNNKALGEKLNLSTHGTKIVISASKIILVFIGINTGSWIWHMLQLIQKFVMVIATYLKKILA